MEMILKNFVTACFLLFALLLGIDSAGICEIETGIRDIPAYILSIICFYEFAINRVDKKEKD